MARPHLSKKQRKVCSRFKIHAVNFLCSIPITILGPAGIGVLMRMADASAYGPIAHDFSGIPGVRPTEVQRHWSNGLSDFFSYTSEGWAFADNDVMSVELLVVRRANLRSLVPMLAERWGARCVYCDAADVPLEVEHIRPLCRGGNDDIANLTLACELCNLRKGRKTAEEFGFPHIASRARQLAEGA